MGAVGWIEAAVGIFTIAVLICTVLWFAGFLGQVGLTFWRWIWHQPTTAAYDEYRRHQSR